MTFWLLTPIFSLICHHIIFAGLFLASIFDELSTTMQAGVGSFYTNMLLCGFLWPLEGMPSVLRDLAMYLPCTAACQGRKKDNMDIWT